MKPAIAASPFADRRTGPTDLKLAHLLDCLERDGTSSQRKLATELGVAVGLVNAYLKRCVKKGLVKVGEVPSRRYVYYLTPQGFAEKARLTSDYLGWSMTYFRRARRECGAAFEEARARGWSTIVLIGASDLAEIAVMSAMEHGVAIAAIVDPGVTKPRICGVPVSASLGEVAGRVDAALVTAVGDVGDLVETTRAALGPERVMRLAIAGVQPAADAAGPQSLAFE